MNEEQVEAAAVKGIAKWCLDNPRPRLSPRQKHVLKQQVKNWINQWRRNVVSPDEIPAAKWQGAMSALVRDVAARPVNNG